MKTRSSDNSVGQQPKQTTKVLKAKQKKPNKKCTPKKLTTNRSHQIKENVSSCRDLKLTFSKAHSIRPWIESKELESVYQLIYSSITLIPSKRSDIVVLKDSLDGSDKKDLQFNLNNLRQARRRVAAWKDRTANIQVQNYSAVFIPSYLATIESILSILIEKYKNHNDLNKSVGEDSLLYSLYCMFLLDSMSMMLILVFHFSYRRYQLLQLHLKL